MHPNVWHTFTKRTFTFARTTLKTFSKVTPKLFICKSLDERIVGEIVAKYVTYISFFYIWAWTRKNGFEFPAK